MNRYLKQKNMLLQQEVINVLSLTLMLISLIHQILQQATLACLQGYHIVIFLKECLASLCQRSVTVCIVFFNLTMYHHATVSQTILWWTHWPELLQPLILKYRQWCCVWNAGAPTQQRKSLKGAVSCLKCQTQLDSLALFPNSKLRSRVGPRASFAVCLQCLLPC